MTGIALVGVLMLTWFGSALAKSGSRPPHGHRLLCALAAVAVVYVTWNLVA